MIDEASLEKALLKMEREVLALKTSHLNGVGTIQFFSKQITIPEATGYTQIKIVIADGEPMPPFCIIRVSDKFFNVVRYDRWVGNEYTYGFSSSDPVGGMVVAISSSAIKSLEKL